MQWTRLTPCVISIAEIINACVYKWSCKVAQVYIVGVKTAIYITQCTSSIILIAKVEVRAVVQKYNFQNIRKGEILQKYYRLTIILRYLGNKCVFDTLRAEEGCSHLIPKHTHKPFSRHTSSPYNTRTLLYLLHLSFCSLQFSIFMNIGCVQKIFIE